MPPSNGNGETLNAENSESGFYSQSEPTYEQFMGRENWIRKANYIGRLTLVILGYMALVVAIVTLVAIVGLALYTFIIHVVFPSRGWLEPQEEQRIVSMASAVYNSVTPAALPLLLINSWAIWYVTRREQRKHDEQRRQDSDL